MNLRLEHILVNITPCIWCKPGEMRLKNGNKVMEESSGPKKQTYQETVVQYFVKIYTCVDQDIEHEVFWRAVRKVSKKSKRVYVIITETIPSQCLTFA